MKLISDELHFSFITWSNFSPLYYIGYVILAIYMLDSDPEPSYDLSKNLLLLPRILKLIEDMVDDPLSIVTHTFTNTLST